MPILTLQQQARELGRIRIGEFVRDGGSKPHPGKLDRFRLTSASRPLLDSVSTLYGGTVREWTPVNGGAGQWEVITAVDRLPVLVPPDPVSQWYELWSGGGCMKRCDGQRDVIADSPCSCDPDPESRECSPTTRLNVVLRDVPGIGVWRLESHGYYAAVQLPAVAEFLAVTRGYVNADLVLTEHVVKRPGEPTKRFMVPGLEILDVTPGQLMAGGVPGAVPALGPGTAAPALEAPHTDDQLYIDSAAAAGTLDQLSALLVAAQREGYARNMGDTGNPVVAAFLAARARLYNPPAVPTDQAEPDPDQLWTEVVAHAPEDWSTDQVEADFLAVTGVSPAEATARQIAMYLARAGAGAR